MKPILNNVPLTEKDIHDDHASFFMAKKGVLLKDVQAAKRLLKQKIYDLCYDDHKYYLQLIEVIDACFQIDDGKEAKE